MGLQLKHRERDNKWRAWTTISDGWLTGWLTEPSMKQYLVEREEERFKLKAIEIMMSFPNGYGSREGKILRGPAVDYYEWHSVILKDYDTYDEKVDDKFAELTHGLLSPNTEKNDEE